MCFDAKTYDFHMFSQVLSDLCFAWRVLCLGSFFLFDFLSFFSISYHNLLSVCPSLLLLLWRPFCMPMRVSMFVLLFFDFC